MGPDGRARSTGWTARSATRCSSRTATTSIRFVRRSQSGHVKALAQITGGGLPENLPRVLPDGVDAEIELGSWPIPPLFRLVRELTPQMSTDELYRTLNMGIGMVVVCGPDDADDVQAAIPETTWRIGRLVAGRPLGHPRLTGRCRHATDRRAGLRLRIEPAGDHRRMCSTVSSTPTSSASCRTGPRPMRSRAPTMPASTPSSWPGSDDEERRHYDARLAGVVAAFEPDWVVLAGWMRILTSEFLDRFPDRVVNLHPALPGELPGTRSDRAGVGRSGCR